MFDLHTTLGAGDEHGELLRLAVYLHVHVTRMWLSQAGAPTDLRRRAVFLARRLAHEHGSAPVVGMATFGVADVLAGAGAVDLARAELDDYTAPAVTVDTVCMVGALTAQRHLRHVASHANAPTSPSASVTAPRDGRTRRK